MKRLTTLLLVLTLAGLTLNAEGYERYYTNLPVEMPVPELAQIPDNIVNINDFGGVGDGLTLNTEAFQKAIAALEKMGGGHLVVPAGIYLSGLISLKDNIELYFEVKDTGIGIKEEDIDKIVNSILKFADLYCLVLCHIRHPHSNHHQAVQQAGVV